LTKHGLLKLKTVGEDVVEVIKVGAEIPGPLTNCPGVTVPKSMDEIDINVLGPVFPIVTSAIASTGPAVNTPTELLPAGERLYVTFPDVSTVAPVITVWGDSPLPVTYCPTASVPVGEMVRIVPDIEPCAAATGTNDKMPPD